MNPGLHWHSMSHPNCLLDWTRPGSYTTLYDQLLPCERDQRPTAGMEKRVQVTDVCLRHDRSNRVLDEVASMHLVFVNRTRTPLGVGGRLDCHVVFTCGRAGRAAGKKNLNVTFFLPICNILKKHNLVWQLFL
jgi:hypothetical protein